MHKHICPTLASLELPKWLGEAKKVPDDFIPPEEKVTPEAQLEQEKLLAKAFDLMFGLEGIVELRDRMVAENSSTSPGHG